MDKKNNKGFTLFELLVSISIIAILTALASLSYSSAQKKARDTRRMEDLKAVQNAAEQYYSLSNFTYPLSENDIDNWTTTDGHKVIDVFPTDPKTKNRYEYEVLTDEKYCVCADMEDDSKNNSDISCNFAAGGNYYCIKGQQ